MHTPLNRLHTLLSWCDLHGAIAVREQLKSLKSEYERSEDNLRALQSVGQMIGEVLKELTPEKCI